LAQDDYYYEIQLTNKQLVFYFMAGAAGLILSFLAGVMVGRGVEGGAASASETRPITEERVVAEASPSPVATAPAPSDYSYPHRLESEKPEEGLDHSRAGAASTPVATPAPGVARPAAAPTPAVATPKPAPATPRAPVATPTPTLPTPPPPGASRAAAPPAGPLPKALASSAAGFAIQVGAFKDKASADSIVRSLKARGLPAYAMAPAVKGGGLFTVRVGVYRDRADAEAVQERLRDDKFKPYVIKQ
jgi:DedD protein